MDLGTERLPPLREGPNGCLYARYQVHAMQFYGVLRPREAAPNEWSAIPFRPPGAPNRAQYGRLHVLGEKADSTKLLGGGAVSASDLALARALVRSESSQK